MSGDSLNPEQFDKMIPRREQARMEGQALGEHLWNGLEAIFGNMKVQGQSQAYDTLRKNFPNHEVHIGEDGDPFVKHQQGDWTIKHHTGMYSDIEHRKHGPVDVINWGHNGEGRHVKAEHLQGALRDWVGEHGAEYEQHYNTNKRITKWD